MLRFYDKPCLAIGTFIIWSTIKYHNPLINPHKTFLVQQLLMIDGAVCIKWAGNSDPMFTSMYSNMSSVLTIINLACGVTVPSNVYHIIIAVYHITMVGVNQRQLTDNLRLIQSSTIASDMTMKILIAGPQSMWWIFPLTDFLGSLCES